MYNVLTVPGTPSAQPAVYWVQNKMATLNEYNVAIALDKYRVEYIFQASYWGGRSLRGGIILDFLITNPFEQALEVFGDYWHTGQLGANDRLRLALIEQVFGEVSIIWGRESKTIPETIAALRREKIIR